MTTGRINQVSVVHAEQQGVRRKALSSTALQLRDTQHGPRPTRARPSIQSQQRCLVVNTSTNQYLCVELCDCPQLQAGRAHHWGALCLQAAMDRQNPIAHLGSLPRLPRARAREVRTPLCACHSGRPSAQSRSATVNKLALLYWRAAGCWNLLG